MGFDGVYPLQKNREGGTFFSCGNTGLGDEQERRAAKKPGGTRQHKQNRRRRKMTETINSGYSVVRMDGRQGPVGLLEKGVIIASGESRVTEWLREIMWPCAGKPYVTRIATTEGEFNSLVRMPRMAAAFIEVGFFGEAMIGCLDRIRKQYPQLRVALFTVSPVTPDETARYLHWSGGGFISLRDRPERVEEQLKAVFGRGNRIPENLLRDVEAYGRLSAIPPHLTHQEIEVARCMAREQTIKGTAYSLKISVRTVNYHLGNIYRKFGVHNMVGVLKLAVSQGILPKEEMYSCRFKYEMVTGSTATR
jgi:DNA-binding NarL/FixJ family response regulator